MEVSMKNKLVIVVWRDTRTEDDWHPKGVIEDLIPAWVRSVGWLVHEDRERIVISSMISDGGMYGHTESIPSGCVVDLIEVVVTDTGPEDKFWVTGKI